MKKEAGFEDFLIRLRELVGSNATEFARSMDIAPSLLHYYLTGQRTPGLIFFLKLAKNGIDVNKLLIGESYKHTSPEFQWMEDYIQKHQVAEQRAKYLKTAQEKLRSSPLGLLSASDIESVEKFLKVASIAITNEIRERKKSAKKAG